MLILLPKHAGISAKMFRSKKHSVILVLQHCTAKPLDLSVSCRLLGSTWRNTWYNVCCSCTFWKWKREIKLAKAALVCGTNVSFYFYIGPLVIVILTVVATGSPAWWPACGRLTVRRRHQVSFYTVRLSVSTISGSSIYIYIYNTNNSVWTDGEALTSCLASFFGCWGNRIPLWTAF